LSCGIIPQAGPRFQLALWQGASITPPSSFAGEIIMDANIGVMLVVGFPLALIVAMWVFGKVSVRPE